MLKISNVLISKIKQNSETLYNLFTLKQPTDIPSSSIKTYLNTLHLQLFSQTDWPQKFLICLWKLSAKADVSWGKKNHWKSVNWTETNLISQRYSVTHQNTKKALITNHGDRIYTGYFKVIDYTSHYHSPELYNLPK